MGYVKVVREAVDSAGSAPELLLEKAVERIAHNIY